jgi:hypothetical protein
MLLGRADEVLEFADDLNRVKRLAWASQAAAAGVDSNDTSVQGLVYVLGILVDRIEELENRIDELRKTKAMPPTAA